MIKILLKCESPEEAAMYLEAPRIRGGLDSYAYWLRSKIKHADLPPEAQAFAEEAQREFFENLGEML
jgi:hypothetical protein